MNLFKFSLLIFTFNACQAFDAGLLEWGSSRKDGQDTTHYAITVCALCRVTIDYLKSAYKIDVTYLNSKFNETNGKCQGTIVTEIVKVLTNSQSSGVNSWQYATMIKTIASSNTKTDLKEVFKAESHFDSESFFKGSQLVLQRYQSAVDNVLKVGNYDQARRSFGEMLHTLQDFYSHSNYIELQYSSPHEALGRRIFRNNEYASANMRTCISCKGQQCQTTSNLDPTIENKKLLTSGYFIAIGPSIFKPKKPKGKCSHGGVFDSSANDEPTGGINKDTLGAVHGHLHYQAARMAYRATVDIITKFRQDIGDDAFGLFLTLKKNLNSLVISIDTECSIANYVDLAKDISINIVNQYEQLEFAPHNYILLTFNSVNTQLIINTAKPADLIKAITKLNSCQRINSTIGARYYHSLVQALKQCEYASVIYTFTDSSARDGYLKHQARALLRTKRAVIYSFMGQRMKRHFLNTKQSEMLDPLDGSNNSTDLATISGGLTYPISGQDQSVIAEFVLRRLEWTKLQSIFMFKSNSAFIEFNIDRSIDELHLDISSMDEILNITQIELRAPDSPLYPLVSTAVNTRHLYMWKIMEPIIGTWYLKLPKLSQNINYDVQIQGKTNIVCLSTLQKEIERTSDSSGYTQLTTEPIIDSELFILTTCENFANTAAQISLITQAGDIIARYSSFESNLFGTLTKIRVPKEKFRIQTIITQLNGAKIQRIEKQLISPTKFSIELTNQPYTISSDETIQMNYTIRSTHTALVNVQLKITDTLDLLNNYGIEKNITFTNETFGMEILTLPKNYKGKWKAGLIIFALTAEDAQTRMFSYENDETSSIYLNINLSTLSKPFKEGRTSTRKENQLNNDKPSLIHLYIIRGIIGNRIQIFSSDAIEFLQPYLVALDSNQSHAGIKYRATTSYEEVVERRGAELVIRLAANIQYLKDILSVLSKIKNFSFLNYDQNFIDEAKLIVEEMYGTSLDLSNESTAAIHHSKFIITKETCKEALRIFTDVLMPQHFMLMDTRINADAHETYSQLKQQTEILRLPYCFFYKTVLTGNQGILKNVLKDEMDHLLNRLVRRGLLKKGKFLQSSKQSVKFDSYLKYLPSDPSEQQELFYELKKHNIQFEEYQSIYKCSTVSPHGTIMTNEGNAALQKQNASLIFANNNQQLFDAPTSRNLTNHENILAMNYVDDAGGIHDETSINRINKQTSHLVNNQNDCLLNKNIDTIALASIINHPQQLSVFLSTSFSNLSTNQIQPLPSQLNSSHNFSQQFNINDVRNNRNIDLIENENHVLSKTRVELQEKQQIECNTEEMIILNILHDIERKIDSVQEHSTSNMEIEPAQFTSENQICSNFHDSIQQQTYESRNKNVHVHDLSQINEDYRQFQSSILHTSTPIEPAKNIIDRSANSLSLSNVSNFEEVKTTFEPIEALKNPNTIDPRILLKCKQILLSKSPIITKTCFNRRFGGDVELCSKSIKLLIAVDLLKEGKYGANAIKSYTSWIKMLPTDTKNISNTLVFQQKKLNIFNITWQDYVESFKEVQFGKSSKSSFFVSLEAAEILRQQSYRDIGFMFNEEMVLIQKNKCANAKQNISQATSILTNLSETTNVTTKEDSMNANLVIMNNNGTSIHLNTEGFGSDTKSTATSIVNTSAPKNSSSSIELHMCSLNTSCDISTADPVSSHARTPKRTSDELSPIKTQPKSRRSDS